MAHLGKNWPVYNPGRLFTSDVTWPDYFPTQYFTSLLGPWAGSALPHPTVAPGRGNAVLQSDYPNAFHVVAPQIWAGKPLTTLGFKVWLDGDGTTKIDLEIIVGGVNQVRPISKTLSTGTCGTIQFFVNADYVPIPGSKLYPLSSVEWNYVAWTAVPAPPPTSPF